MENIQRRRTAEEMFPVVEAWQDSGLSKKAFCEERGIIKSVFFYWCNRYREEKVQGGFVPFTERGLEKYNEVELFKNLTIIMNLQ